MGLFVIQNSNGIILFVWIVSVLTLSKSDIVAKTDGIASLTSGLNTTSSVHVLSKNEHQQTLPSSINSTSESAKSTKTFNNNGATPSVAGEGGPILIPSAMQNATATFHTAANHSESVENKKNTKIVSRKGANEMLNVKEENVTKAKITLSNDTKLPTELSLKASNIGDNEKRVDLDTNNSKSNTTAWNNTVNSVNVTQEKLPNSTTTVTASSAVQEHRPKPTATVVGPNSDKRAFISHTKGLHLGMSKKIDYVLPVIVTLIALPILGAIIFMIYKQGRDCWDKRHYRRMDFLIDGMYND